ncbi:hypothetical protein OAD01_03380 [Candidatus Marinimicrobia bacterium]|jgi:hypothetical protein|nr:hypothetical protein [Candidatus Neomarinimicrobiota bacterium]
MKNFKSYVIGFLTCICLFLIMGQTKSDGQIGRYQISTASTFKGVKYWVYETTLDTRTGKIIKREQYATKFYDKHN